LTRLLEHGFAVCGVDAGESYGSPDGTRIFHEFYRTVVERYGLSPRACLLPQSRGGLMLYAWAAERPEAVECVGGIYPVCDLRSYPGLSRASGAYRMTEDELRSALEKYNPIDRLAPLAARGVPILHVHGDADQVVPLEANSLTMARRYRALGGTFGLLVTPGKGHEEVPEFFESQALLDFFLSLGRNVLRR
jgi:dipeptidyl aminopeptidase/acylaminoacyl peptidase